MDETSLTQSIRFRLQAVHEQMAAAARKAGRSPSQVRLLVVTKTHPLETVRAALAAGAALLGENYPEEALTKITALQGEAAQWHMIGHLQSRKASLVAEHFSYLHSLDSLRLAQRLDHFCAQAGRTLPVLLECNVSGETSKFGYPAQTPAQREQLLKEVEALLTLPHLSLRGLMTMPPLGEDPRPHFARLRELKQTLAEHFPQASWEELSMGTSADFEAAIEEGATFIRVGTAILGARPARA